MTTTTGINNIKSIVADNSGPFAWLRIQSDGGNTVNVFLPLSVAEAMADAYADAMEAHENAAEAQALAVQAAGYAGNGYADQQTREAGRGHLVAE